MDPGKPYFWAFSPKFYKEEESSEADRFLWLQHDGAAAVNGGQLPQQLLPNNSGDVAAAAHQASPSAVTQIKLTKSEQDTKPPGQDQLHHQGTQFDIQ